MCVHVVTACMYSVCMCVHIHMHACTLQKTKGVFLYLFLPYSLETGLARELSEFACLCLLHWVLIHKWPYAASVRVVEIWWVS